MTLLNHALRAGRSSPATAAAAATVLVAGGGGALGSAVLEALLAGRRFAPVKVLAARALTTAMHGLEPVVVDGFDDAAEPAGTPIADTAVIVFDRKRHANGRELAFVRPQPHDLPALARWLHARGVKQLVVVLPHTPADLRELAAQLPASDAGTRVAPPELVWQAAQLRDAALLVQAWLARGELPELTAPRRWM